MAPVHLPTFIVTMHSSTAQHNTRTRATATARPSLTSGTTAGLRLCHRDCIRGSQMSVSTPASLLLRLHSCVATCRSRRRATAARTVAEATVSRPDSGGGHRQPTGQWRRPPSADRTVAEATVSRPGRGGGHSQPTGRWRRPPSANRTVAEATVSRPPRNGTGQTAPSSQATGRPS